MFKHKSWALLNQLCKYAGLKLRAGVIQIKVADKDPLSGKDPGLR